MKRNQEGLADTSCSHLLQFWQALRGLLTRKHSLLMLFWGRILVLVDRRGTAPNWMYPRITVEKLRQALGIVTSYPFLEQLKLKLLRKKRRKKNPKTQNCNFPLAAYPFLWDIKHLFVRLELSQCVFKTQGAGPKLLGCRVLDRYAESEERPSPKPKPTRAHTKPTKHVAGDNRHTCTSDNYIICTPF